MIDLHVRWKFKLREGCDEGEVILTTRLIKEDEFELNFTGNNTGGWKRVLRKAGLIKKHWEIDSLEGGAYRWEKDEKVVKAGFVVSFLSISCSLLLIAFYHIISSVTNLRILSLSGLQPSSLLLIPVI